MGRWFIVAKKQKEERIYCIPCEKDHPARDFYISYNPMHKGYIPYCKKSIKKSVKNSDGSVVLDKFKDVLRQSDIPFLIDYWEGAVSAGGDIVGRYFKDMKLKQNRNLTWKDSVFHNETIVEDNPPKKQNKEGEEENYNIHQLREKWGEYSKDELLAFERKYRSLKNHYSEKTAMHTEALLTYIRYRVKEELATSKGNVKEAKEWGAMASKAATDAKINPSQLSKADLSDGLSTFSELSQAVEKEVDIIRILPKFKARPNDALDFNIWCYVNYIRDLSGLPPCKYEDVYKFYDKNIENYIKERGDPYGIFSEDMSTKNRENIKRFIDEDEEEGGGE